MPGNQQVWAHAWAVQQKKQAKTERDFAEADRIQESPERRLVGRSGMGGMGRVEVVRIVR